MVFNVVVLDFRHRKIVIGLSIQIIVIGAVDYFFDIDGPVLALGILVTVLFGK